MKNKYFIKKSSFLINDIDTNKIIAFNKFLFGNQDFKYSTGFRDSEKVRPLYIFCPQIIIYKRNFGENRRIYFLVK